MTLTELKEKCLEVKGGGVILVIPRKCPPSSGFIRVKGMGKGYVLNAQEKNGRWEIVASFDANGILKNIAKEEERLNASRTAEETSDG